MVSPFFSLSLGKYCTATHSTKLLSARSHHFSPRCRHDAGTMHTYPNGLAMHQKSITHMYPAFAAANASGLSSPRSNLAFGRRTTQGHPAWPIRHFRPSKILIQIQNDFQGISAAQIWQRRSRLLETQRWLHMPRGPFIPATPWHGKCLLQNLISSQGEAELRR